MYVTVSCSLKMPTAAVAFAWLTAPSTSFAWSPETIEMDADWASSGSPVNEVARSEKSSGIVTTAAYEPSARPSFASAASVITQLKFVSSVPTRPAVSWRPSGASCPSISTGTSSFTIAAVTVFRRAWGSQSDQTSRPAIASGTSTRPSNESHGTLRPVRAWSREVFKRMIRPFRRRR